MRLHLHQLHMVVPEVVYPGMQKGIAAGHLGLVSDEVLLQLSMFEVRRPMVVDGWVLYQPVNEILFLLSCEGPLPLIQPWKTPSYNRI